MDEMRDEYEFAGPGRPNPYSERLKKPVTIRLDEDTIAYFKALAGKTGIGYQALINSFLTDCARCRVEPDLTWNPRLA
jgi:uncharacterized protein (DUF4415 family)